MIENNIKVIDGKNKILLSAPHSVLHMRENSIRPKETKTGVIVRTLANKYKVYGIYKLKNEFNDANWDKDCKYKLKVAQIVNKEKIKALIDVHGMAAHRQQDICIGINGGKNICGYDNVVEDMVIIFKKYGFKNVTIDEPFSAKYEYCVSNYISRACNILTFQIEINLKYRSAKYKEYTRYQKIISSLVEIIDLLEEKITQV